MTNKNTTTELKPCPFCGGKAQLLEAMGEAWYICTECKSSCGLSTGSVNRAIAAWNRRSAAHGEPSNASKIDEYARSLAMHLWREHYRKDSPQFELLEETWGVLSQIDNMLTGLTRKAGSAEQVSEREVVALADDEMPPLPHTTYNGYADGSEPLYTAEHMRDYARAFADTPKQQTATIQPEMNMRHIQDSECIQGKCARQTTGCVGKCGLKESTNKAITQPPCTNEFVAAGCELFTPSPVAENGDKVLVGIQCVCISANQEYTRCNGVIPDWDLGFFAGQLHIFDQYLKADKSAIAEAKDYIAKLAAQASAQSTDAENVK